MLTVALLRPSLPRLLCCSRLALMVCRSSPRLSGCFLLGIDTTALRPTPTRPQTNSLFYALNGDTGQALWASDDQKPDAWTTQFLGANPRRDLCPTSSQ